MLKVWWSFFGTICIMPSLMCYNLYECFRIVSALEDFASNVLRSTGSIDIDHYAPNIAIRAIKMPTTNSFSGMLCAAFVPGPGQLDDFGRQNVKCHMNNMTSAQLDVTKGVIITSLLHHYLYTYKQIVDGDLWNGNFYRDGSKSDHYGITLGKASTKW